ncbi:MAG: 3'-5' exonuclease, partial [Gemmatimonadetes bacterium]|nr:3'-5' exonuclease [Gemmatimonadota bacterium]NIR36967.1 3'-5' exonuclease [Actinomycetota bacterium]NIS31385.1 3'-5' exonuclease [Actinomycetota bacterium]NIU66501.1 3'-5' exonuclease [Actinomycetota bacterium]NIW28313.1 DNA polymerase III subunit epsilon [Actinomycetota bacterium]
IDAGEALDRLSLLLDGRVVIGHHVAFDLAVLRFEAARRARPWSEPPALDTAHLAAALEPGLPDLGLESVASWLGVSIAGRHTASGDS